MTNFEKEMGKAFSQRQLKNRWDALKKEWKAWKKLKGKDTSLGWNPIKRTIDAPDDWWESRLKVVPEAQKFRTSGIDPKFEGKLDQMFIGIVATGDKAWAPFSDTLRSDFLEDVNNEIPEENEEENVMSIVENSSSDESDDEREKKEILQRMECFNRLFVVASSSVQLYYEKMSKMVFISLLRVLETRYNLQTSRNISSSEMLGTFLYILGTSAKVSQCQERFQRSGSTISRYFAIVLEKVSRMATDLIAPEDLFFSSVPEQIRNDSRYMPHFKDYIGAIDGTHIAAILPPNEQIPYIRRKDIPTQNVMAVCDFNMCFTFVMAGWKGSAHDTRIFLDAIQDPKYKFPYPPNGYLRPYKGQRYHLPDFRRGRPISDPKTSYSRVIARNREGLVMASCTYLWKNIPDPTTAEARACFKAVSFAKEMGFRDVYVEGDALTIIRKLKSAEKDRSAVARFVPRGANTAAHGLAMEGRKYTWPMYWVEEVSRTVEWLVDKDQSGSRGNDRL
ncbi:hypothetical protein GOBAR_AA06689 [Gossypium barbadense]|uniref:Myb/SANT-like domain-containing protein n=1 Tax=Gossypium barbadense TaxID=3634 RepID=A0A2P5YE60_GOSBA|nr:hypothetical protein GOBAR_AA06689 [Gossypium barbadense]